MTRHYENLESKKSIFPEGLAAFTDKARRTYPVLSPAGVSSEIYEVHVHVHVNVYLMEVMLRIFCRSKRQGIRSK